MPTIILQIGRVTKGLKRLIDGNDEVPRDIVLLRISHDVRRNLQLIAIQIQVIHAGFHRDVDAPLLINSLRYNFVHSIQTENELTIWLILSGMKNTRLFIYFRFTKIHWWIRILMNVFRSWSTYWILCTRIIICKNSCILLHYSINTYNTYFIICFKMHTVCPLPLN